jgi:PAS domain S-box-containing protein
VVEVLATGEAWSGLGREDLLGRFFWECGFWAESSATVREAVAVAMGGDAWRGEVGYVRGGRPGRMGLTCEPVRDASGQVAGVVATGTEAAGRPESQAGGERLATAILESITDAFFALDRDWRFTYLNRQAGIVLDRSPDDLLGRVIWSEYPGLDGSVFESAYRRTMEDGQPTSVSAYYPDHDRYYEVHAYPASEGISVYFRDVTQRVRVDAELRRLDDQRRLALDSARLGSWHLDPATGELTTDLRMREIFGVAGESLNFEEAIARIHPEDRDAIRKAVAASIDPEQPAPYSVEHRIVLPDGSIRWVLVNGSANFRDAGEAEHRAPAHSLDGVIADITDRKQAVERLRESEERYRTLFESIDEGFCVLEMLYDSEGRAHDYRFVEANPALERQTGLKNVIGHRIREYAPDHEAIWFERYGHVAETGEPLRYKAKARQIAGGRWFDVYAFRVGRPEERRVAVLFQDVTEARKAETAREALVDQLQEADRKKNEFLAMLAHELRSPVAAVSNASALLRLSSATANLEFAQGVLQRQSRQLARLLDDLLDVARITSGKLVVRPIDTDLRPVLEHAVSLVRPLMEERGHRLDVKLDAGPMPLWADPARLEQIAVNLLTNAAKYTDNGGQVALRAGRDGDWLVVSVSDNGIGMTSETLGNVFAAFTQGERSPARSEGGLGLGLTIVRSLAELHGGEATATSDGPGRGSTFTVRLPAGRASSSLPIEWASNDHMTASGVSRRVLVVDDNTDAADGLARLLRMQGHEVTTAADGLEAVEAASRLDPDVILLDIGLPRLDGYEVARRIRMAAALRGAVDSNRPRIIALSGYGQEDDRRRSREAGFDHHLVKPVELCDVLPLIPGAAGSTELDAGEGEAPVPARPDCGGDRPSS